ncbi:keratin, type II cytoskeletal 1-like [Dicentrarchus labrax]|uniref:keratin, type II cytoskeletal 1-like n=1 Tax=Dicentrarchus labrax TaxID=13489 RepID=UPI0021F66934|nr:keratin, type II cytoskeletal 1-like [Dicentrarchus labrax]XP_051273972.1 keratin, type II cytoskeletal 1-like [Dicentrarchus labrax]XP_051273973.1 keratin, type II cytoskeletal 1-like [Dicentrarchus labrax]XP_051273974.1 keratin, type II cytoskeletal 1-like [Dicentrarchus labrax]
MENLFDFEGGSVDYRAFSTSADPKDELIASLTSFIKLYSQHKNSLQTTSESFRAAQLHEMPVSGSTAFHSLCSLFGGVTGATGGGLSGGVFGAFGAIGAVTVSRFCDDDIKAIGATVGVVGSVLGGAAGGALGGAVGSTVGAAVEATGSRVDAVVSNVASFAIGLATGSAIGGIFGGAVGAAGGAFGGAFGALCTTKVVVNMVGEMVRAAKNSDCKKMKVNVMQKTGDFSKAFKLLVEELKTIKALCDKMASSDVVRSVAGQTAKTLASVATMEETLRDSQSAADLPQFVSSVEEAARLSKNITEEVETTRTEVEKLLVLLRKP